MGKTHKQHEFGCKASVAVTRTTGTRIGTLSFNENLYDGHTLPQTLEQYWTITEPCPSFVICDHGQLGRELVGDTQTLPPKPQKRMDSQDQP